MDNYKWTYEFPEAKGIVVSGVVFSPQSEEQSSHMEVAWEH